MTSFHEFPVNLSGKRNSPLSVRPPASFREKSANHKRFLVFQYHLQLELWHLTSWTMNQALIFRIFRLRILHELVVALMKQLAPAWNSHGGFVWDTCRLGLGTLVRDIATCGREKTEMAENISLPWKWTPHESFLDVSNEEPLAQPQAWILCHTDY